MTEDPEVPEGTCQRCGKEPATVHIRRVKADAEESIHVCVDCARELGAAPESSQLAHDPLAVLFRSMEETRDTGAICAGCGLTFERFRETGRLGCGQCYTTFAGELRLLVRRIHGATAHTGKTPVGEDQLGDAEAAVRRLTEELDRAVVTEDYERAAKLRDRLREVRGASAGGDER